MYPYIYQINKTPDNDSKEIEKQLCNFNRLFSTRCVSEKFGINKRKARKIVKIAILKGYIDRFKKVE